MAWPRRSLTVLPFTVGVVIAEVAGCGWGELTGGEISPTEVTSPERSFPVTEPATTSSTVVVPPLDPAFVAIADRITLTEEARTLLALSQPGLVDKTTLASTCTLDLELSVLGCYKGGNIAVLAIADPRLDGMTEATTAHEVLHAAWHALGDDEQAGLAVQLQETFDRVASDDMVDRIEAYRRRDSAVIDSELHSILGTEVRDIGPGLEAYYARWFVDRAAVVTLAETTRSTFSSLEQQVADLDTRLSDLRIQIETGEADLENGLATIDADQAALEALRSDGRIDEYNAAVGPFNELVRSYNDQVTTHQAVIDQYNALVIERNDLAAAYTDLVGQITTTAESLPVS